MRAFDGPVLEKTFWAHHVGDLNANGTLMKQMDKPWRVSTAAQPEFGEEPPLLSVGGQRGVPDKRDISIRWLAGTVLTGATALILMGGALFVALDGQYSLALPAGVIDRSSTGLSATSSQRIVKSDMLRFQDEAPRNKEVIEVTTVTRENDKDRIRVKPYLRVQSRLSTRRDPLTPEIPNFNPVSLYADKNEDAPIEVISDAISTASVDGEVAISNQAFPQAGFRVASGVELTTAEAETIVRDAAHFLVDGSIQVEAMPYVAPERLSISADPLRQHFARVVPENMTQLTRVTAAARGIPPLKREELILAEGMTLKGTLSRASLPMLDIDRIGSLLSETFNIEQTEAGDVLTLWFDPRIDNRGIEPLMRMTLFRNSEHLATIGRRDSGELVKAPPRLPIETTDEDAAEQALLASANSGQALTTYQAIYQTAFHQEIPSNIIPELIKIFSYDVDFNRTARLNDGLRVFYGLANDNSLDVADEILYAALTLDGEQKNYYRFRTPDDGAVDYYDENGRSAKKFLMRKPIVSGRYRSGFGMRRHPILGYRRMHKGVDWSAPRGTAILAAGDGVVTHAKWSSGYGRQIEISHVNGYRTSYSHQTRFAKGIAAGARVRQGQVIGYVGSTGLSTGPHLHYEVTVNGRHVDPMRIRLPRGRVLEGEVLEAFKAEKQRVDALLAREGKDPSELQLADAS